MNFCLNKKCKSSLGPAVLTIFERKRLRASYLTYTQRMTYLQMALVGNAKSAIGGMLNHGHLYKAALTELEEQFGNEELVAGAFMKTILDDPIGAEGDVTQLRSFSNALHNAVATMKSLGYSYDLASSTNTHAALQKLPDPLKEK